MAIDNQYGFYRDVQLNNGALVVTGITGGGGGSGTSGTSGSSGTSGTSGAPGTNGTSGTSGAPGSSGTSGASGTSFSRTGSHFNFQLTPGFTYNLAVTAADGNQTLEANAIWAFPFTPGRDISMSALTIETTSTSASGLIKILAWDHNVSLSVPGNLIIESPSIPVSGSNFTVREYLVDYTFSAGTTYWLGIAANSTGNVGVRGVPTGASITYGVPGTGGSGWRYNMVRTTSFTYPTIPSTWPGTGYNFATNYEIRIKPI
jgi:hypothetical protein